MSQAFDVALIVIIVISVVAVLLESVKEIDRNYHSILVGLEWTITILFTIEYILRIYSTDRKWHYASSFYGIVDLISIIPTYLSLFFTSTQYLAIIRILRLLRIFRIFKLTQFLGESYTLIIALKASRIKITVFLTAVLSCSVVLGALMYIIETDEAGFTSIPRSIYWAIVTLTTVGYGDISPQTPLGQAVASIVMILGYGVIAVPTGIVSAEMANAKKEEKTRTILKFCTICETSDLPLDSNFCKNCGSDNLSE